MSNANAINYGKCYWCIKVRSDISPDGEIYLNADSARVVDGAVEFIGNSGYPVLSIAPGAWFVYFAASMLDGHAVAVDHWAGEIWEDQQETKDRPPSADKRRRVTERGKMTKSLRYDVLRRDNFACCVCGATGKDSELEIDHIRPISKGGETAIDNLQTLCKDCNRGKRDKEGLRITGSIELDV